MTYASFSYEIIALWASPCEEVGVPIAGSE